MTDSYFNDLSLDERYLAQEAERNAQIEAENDARIAREQQQKEEGLQANVAGMEGQNTLESEPERGLTNTGIGGYEHPLVAFEAIGTTGTEAFKGLVDTALGLGKLAEHGSLGHALSKASGHTMGPLTPASTAQEWWDKAHPMSEEPLHQMVRKISGVVGPTLLGTGLAQAGLKGVSWFANLSGKKQLVTSIAANLGIDSIVTTASTSATDETIATTLSDNFGVHLPWATKNTDSTDVKYFKQLFENGLLSVGTDLLGVLFGFVKGTPGVGIEYTAKGPQGAELLAKRDIRKAVIKEEATRSPAIKEIDDQINQLGSLGDELTSEGEKALADLVELRKRTEVDELPFKDPDEYTDTIESAYLTKQAQKEEAARRLVQDPERVEFDPFLDGPVDEHAKAVPNTGADPIEAVVDTTTIQKYPTLNPRPAPAVTESFQKDFMNARDGSERADQLQDLFNNMPQQIDAIRDGAQKMSSEDMQGAVNKLASTILGTDIKTFAKDLNSLKTNIQNGQKFLDDESFVVLADAFKKAFDTVYNPQHIRASAVMVQQSGYTVSDASRVANSMGDFVDVTRQTEIALDNLELLATELRANQWIAGYSLQMKKLVKSTKNNPRVGAILEDNRVSFENGLRESRLKARQTIQTLKDIAKNNPEYRKAFTKAFDATNGDVDTLEKLFRFAEDNLGVINKGIYDRNPAVPSLILKGLNGVRHNNILSGLSAVRAASGNAVNIVAKPISAFAGSSYTWLGDHDATMFKRALASYGGVMENLNRARKVMVNDWKLAVSNPQLAMSRGRSDLNFEADQNLEVMESMIEGWRKDGQTGKIALTRMAQGMSIWNNNPIVRWGVNAMYSIDGFTNSMMASASARAKAYDELFESTKGKWDQVKFDEKQRELYSQAFDSTGLLTDKAAKFASSEIALNLDNELVSSMETMMDKVPALKTIFMFPRTGLNGVEMAWSFAPTGKFGPAITRAQRLLRAKTNDEILNALIEHGVDSLDMTAFQALKSEYIGRQVMGSSLVMGTMLMAMNGNLTGNGPQDPAERHRMIEMGWKPLSFKVPGTDQWISYKGLEPFQLLLGLTADIVYQLNRVDQVVGEDIGRKLGMALSMNVTNSTFLAGFEPLMSIAAGDETAVARFTANQVDSMIPGTGARGILSNIITPQLKDVEREWKGYLANRNKYMFNDQTLLADMVDVYTGEPIRYFDPILSRVNAVLPFFKMNGGMEPWRQWLLDTGWDGLQDPRVNPITHQPISPEVHQWINNWIGTKYPLRRRITEMMNHPTDYWTRKVKEYRKGRKNLPQADFPIKQLVVHRELTRLHNKAFRAAWKAYNKYNESASVEGRMRKQVEEQLKRGNVAGARQTQERILDIVNLAK